MSKEFDIEIGYTGDDEYYHVKRKTDEYPLEYAIHKIHTKEQEGITFEGHPFAIMTISPTKETPTPEGGMYRDLQHTTQYVYTNRTFDAQWENKVYNQIIEKDEHVV